MEAPSSSFVVRRVNPTTFSILERDIDNEHPLIYAKVHPDAPIVILSDTGRGKPAEEFKDAEFTQLRDLLEHYPVADNDDKPINPGGKRKYFIIITHCHFDHICGIEQFVGDGNEIIASAAGRDFIESDLPAHSQCKQNGIPVPEYEVTHWAQSMERLTYPLRKHLPGDTSVQGKLVDLEIDILHTPGHTPDELAWADRVERTMYVGDSFYEFGPDGMPIIHPQQGSLIDWVYSMQKVIEYMMLQFDAEVDVEESDDDWTMVREPMRISAAHQTAAQPAIPVLDTLRSFIHDSVDGKKPPLYSDYRHGEVYTYWCSETNEKHPERMMALWCPQRLMDDLRNYYGIEAPSHVSRALDYRRV